MLHPRQYTLSPEGLASLQRTARANQPWSRSTGPRTKAGKSIARYNAWKHGGHREDARQARNALRQVRRLQRFIDQTRAWECYTPDQQDRILDTMIDGMNRWETVPFLAPRPQGD